MRILPSVSPGQVSGDSPHRYNYPRPSWKPSIGRAEESTIVTGQPDSGRLPADFTEKADRAYFGK